ncbi:ABC transporter ATP-binding protein [Pseudonocardia acaciae]|uniref:ABC transporter ATP-binding protein n=1 Tax=Pseudonocardia acaciae TaxID=551276 RepID=UPI00048DE007|nr:ABC transporter ATP-binding protein [Pseudonocardia acaciae]
MLELHRVGFAHPRGDWLFREVDMAVRGGEVTVVLGPNGRGKTTLLRCAAGLLRPLEGEVRGAGAVGYVPQALGSGFGYGVLDMVVMGRARHVRAYSTPSARDRAVAESALRRVGLTGLADRPYAQLSGGERQLVLIARAIASDSEVVILDEPASALDLANQGRVLALLRELADGGLGVLLTTHHPDHAVSLADRVALMLPAGRVETGPADAMLTDDALGELYGVPVRTVWFDDDGARRKVLAPRYG